MKLNELIEKYKRYEGKWNSKTGELARQIFLEDLKQLDEPQPVKVPQCVADYIEESRLKGWDLLASMCFVVSAKNKKTTKWFYLGENKNIFALAWIFGYEVEEEKRYLVKVKGMNRINGCLAHNKELATWYFGISGNSKNHRTNHTRKELEKAGFDWVFSCEGIEIEEVE